MIQYNTLDEVTQNSISTAYDAYGEPTFITIFDFGSATAPGPFLQSEALQYSNGQATSDVVSDSSGAFRETTYAYDGTEVQATSGVPQHTTPYGSRGNLTQILQYVTPTSNTSATVAHNFQYFDTGSLYEDLTVAASLILPTTRQTLIQT